MFISFLRFFLELNVNLLGKKSTVFLFVSDWNGENI